MVNKKGIEMGFNVMFAIFAGIVILALAIYTTTKIIGTGEKIVSTETAAKVVSLLDPLETGLASGKSEQIKFRKETRIFLECKDNENPPFGMQTIQFSEKTFGEKFGEKGGEVPIHNKYVFSRNIIEGKELNLFSKAFSMPFKVADLIIINTDNYCFYQVTSKIRKEIENLNIQNIQFSDDLQNCTGVKVCFGTRDSDCDIKVFGECYDTNCESEYDYGTVSSGSDEIYFIEGLLYAAIFSSKDNYECNVKRLKNKFNELSLIYDDKVDLVQKNNCGTGIKLKLDILRNQNIESSEEFVNLFDSVKELESANARRAGCELW